MKLIVISSPVSQRDEAALVEEFFRQGLEEFHVHKPQWRRGEVLAFRDSFAEERKPQIKIHADFLKFHSIGECREKSPSEGYFFLSPVFNSISKKGYKSRFDLKELKSFLLEFTSGKAFALGGIDEDKIETCMDLGFAGVAVCGAIWESENPLEKFKKIKWLCEKNTVKV